VANIGMDIPQYCRRCGTQLIDGVCPTCAAASSHPAAPPASAPAAPAAHAVDRQRPAQGASQRPWFASTPAVAPAERGAGLRYVGVWNWGAFLLCPFWLMNHGRIGRGVVYLALCCIPLLGLGAFGMAIAYGIKGNEVAATSRHFTGDAQFVAVQNAWRNWGIGVAIAGVILGILIVFAGLMSGRTVDAGKG
jgi:hypothetical protein